MQNVLSEIDLMINYSPARFLTLPFVLLIIRSISGGFVLPTREVPTKSRGGRKTKRIRGIEAESPKEKGPNGGKLKEIPSVGTVIAE
jgi:hypothetical protein